MISNIDSSVNKEKETLRDGGWLGGGGVGRVSDVTLAPVVRISAPTFFSCHFAMLQQMS